MNDVENRLQSEWQRLAASGVRSGEIVQHILHGTVTLTIPTTPTTCVRRPASSAVRPHTPATAFQVTNARVRRNR